MKICKNRQSLKRFRIVHKKFPRRKDARAIYFRKMFNKGAALILLFGAEVIFGTFARSADLDNSKESEFDEQPSKPISKEGQYAPPPFGSDVKTGLAEPNPVAIAAKSEIRQAIKNGDPAVAHELLAQAIHDFPHDLEIRAAADILAKTKFQENVIPAIYRLLANSSNLGRQWMPGGRDAKGRETIISVDLSIETRGTAMFAGEGRILQSAYDKIDSGDAPRAVAELSRAIRKHPDAGPLRYALAMAHAMERDYEKADGDNLQAVTLSHGEPTVLSQRASLMMLMGRRREAYEWANKTLAANPQDPEALAIKGRYLWNDLKRQDEAIMALGSAARVDHEKYDALYQNALIENRSHQAVARMNAGDVKGARSDAQFVLARDPSNPVAHLMMGFANWKEGNVEAAIKESTLAIKNDPKLEWAYFQRSMAMESLGVRGRAIVDMRRAVELNPARFKENYDRLVQAQQQGSPPIWVRLVPPTVIAGAR